MTNELTIGRLADEAGVNVETIRYYQRRGLMAEPDKPTSGHRRYGPAAIKRVRCIKRQVIEEKLADLKAMRKALMNLLRQCDTGAARGNCPIIHALAAD